MPPAIPASTKTSLAQRLRQHARQHWPQLGDLHIRYHGQFAYVEGKYENQILPTGMTAGTPQEALDCACDLYLRHCPPKNLRLRPLSHH